MSIIKDTFFGGAEKKAAQAQVQGVERGIEAVQKSLEEGKAQAIPLFQSGQQNLLGGFQGALDLFGQSAPAQMQAFQGGNVGAQQQLLAGLPLQQAAILGQNVDFSRLQPFQAPQQDLSFLQQQLPQFNTISQALGIAGLSNDPQRPPVPTVGGPLPTAGTPQQQAAMRQLISDNPFSQQNVLGGSGRGGTVDFFNRGQF